MFIKTLNSRICLVLCGLIIASTLIPMERGPKDKEPDIEEISKETEPDETGLDTDIPEQELIEALIRTEQNKKRTRSSTSTSSSSSSRSTRKRTRRLTAKQQEKKKYTLDMLEIYFKEYTQPITSQQMRDALAEETGILAKVLEEYDNAIEDLDTLSAPNLGIAHRAIEERNPVVLQMLLHLQPTLLLSNRHPLGLTPLQLLFTQDQTDPLFLKFLLTILNAAFSLPDNTIFEEVINYSDDALLQALIHQLYVVGRQLGQPTIALPIVQRLEAINPSRVLHAIVAVIQERQAVTAAALGMTLLSEPQPEPEQLTTSQTAATRPVSLIRQLKASSTSNEQYREALGREIMSPTHSFQLIRVSKAIVKNAIDDAIQNNTLEGFFETLSDLDKLKNVIAMADDETLKALITAIGNNQTQLARLREADPSRIDQLQYKLALDQAIQRLIEQLPQVPPNTAPTTTTTTNVNLARVSIPLPQAPTGFSAFLGSSKK